jgi:selenocysteine lyase/cysteine desulfurase
MPSEDFASALNFEYDIAVRGGFHCAPLTHKFLGTEENGLVRASLSVQNSTREIYYFLNAVKKICQG